MSESVMFLPLGVSEDFAERSGLGFEYVTADDIRNILLPRREDAHKGMYGHALLVCGSRGMAGAAILSTGAALRSGCGLVTTHMPFEERMALQANYPSAMLSYEPQPYFSVLPDNLSRFTAVGVGCGVGRRQASVEALAELFMACRRMSIPLVVDADALNMISENSGLLAALPPDSIITPHDAELKRLVGEWGSDVERKFELMCGFAESTRCTIVSKGPNTAICWRGERLYFNSTGNAGMAKGGSGDVLTGLLTGLLARGYRPLKAAILGVYIHGSAGDKARDYYGAEAMNSADLIEFIGEAFRDVE